MGLDMDHQAKPAGNGSAHQEKVIRSSENKISERLVEHGAEMKCPRSSTFTRRLARLDGEPGGSTTLQVHVLYVSLLADDACSLLAVDELDATRQRVLALHSIRAPGRRIVGAAPAPKDHELLLPGLQNVGHNVLATCRIPSSQASDVEVLEKVQTSVGQPGPPGIEEIGRAS